MKRIEFIRELSPVITGLVSEILNKPLETGVLPHDWKSSNISPIFREGASHLTENYYPNELTGYLIKVLERLAEIAIYREGSVTNIMVFGSIRHVCQTYWLPVSHGEQR